MRISKTHPISSILTAAGLASSLFTASAFAQAVAKPSRVITVDNAQDSTTGKCETAIKGQCNLRAAVAKAVASGGNSVIKLAVNSQISAGEMAITAPATTIAPFVLRIESDGPTKLIKGSLTSKLFAISSNTNVTLRNVDITNFQGFNVGVISNAGNLTLAQTIVRANKASCSATGAMTAYASCYAGAIENTGVLTLKNGSKIRNNSVEANASTGSFTNAGAFGGALVSSGTLVLDGDVVFRGNKVNAQANSGYHGSMPGGASASSAGGAISNSGQIIVTPAGHGKCRFLENQAIASASTVNGEATHISKGGAVSTKDLGYDLMTECVFENNTADIDADITVVPQS